MNTERIFHFRSIEGLRFWMAWWVVLGHLANVSGVPTSIPSYFSPIFNGSVAVNVFIIVSGFVITHLIISANENYRSYLVRRIFRLWPAYFIGIGALLLLPHAYKYTFVDLPFGVDVYNKTMELSSVQENYVYHILAHATLTNGIIPNEWLPYSGSAILSPAWSLSLEWQFYVIAPLIVAFSAKNNRRSLILLTASLAIASFMSFQQVLTWRFPSFLPLSGHFFAIGIICRLRINRAIALAGSRYWLPSIVMGSIIAMAAVDGRTDATLGREILIWGIWLRFLRLDNNPSAKEHEFMKWAYRTFASNSVVRHLGNASYSTYILHIPIVAIVVWMASFVVTIDSQAKMIAITFSSAGPIVIVSLLNYHYVEQSFNRIAKRIVSPRAEKLSP